MFVDFPNPEKEYDVMIKKTIDGKIKNTYFLTEVNVSKFENNINVTYKNHKVVYGEQEINTISSEININGYKLIKTREAKYGWKFAEQCSFEPTDEILFIEKINDVVTFGHNAYDTGDKLICKGVIHSVCKTFIGGEPFYRLSAEITGR